MIFGLSLLFVFLILAALYESWTLPFSVLLSTPVAVFGAFAVLWLRRLLIGVFYPPFMVQIESDVYSQIGLVMLIGLAAKNAILIVEFAKDEHDQGKPLVDAALEGARLRLRPILMTSLAFIFGCIPLWTATGAGSVARQIMGTTVIGGMLAASALGIFFVPALFCIVEKFSKARAGSHRLRVRCLFSRKIRKQETTKMRRLATLLILAFACGCAVGPNYRKPAVNVPPSYRGVTPEEAAKGEARSLADEKWWEVFQDEQLKELVKTALQQNYDVRIAAARILEAQAQLGITRADQFPTIAGDAGATNQRNPRSKFLPAFETSTDQVGGSLAWDLDFWGKYRRATEAARAELMATEWARREVISALIADVASAYFQLRALDLQLEISQRTLTSRRDSLRLTSLLAQGGSTSMLDVRQAEQLVFTAASEVPSLEQQIEQEENFISTLLGNNPAPVPRGRKLTEQEHPPTVPAGLPSSLLERRPDIRQAEEQLISANAQIGIARAAYFPQISLTATAGYQSSALTGLFSGPAGLWNFGGTLIQPIFTAGKLRSNVRLTRGSTARVPPPLSTDHPGGFPRGF